ncbi:MAG: DUF2064 domain-containing protein [Thermoleophilia bacterium]
MKNPPANPIAPSIAADESVSERAALAVMVRAVVPGRVKTRLADRLGDLGAAAVYRALRDDTIARAMEVGATEVGAPEFLRPDQPRLPGPPDSHVALYLAVDPSGAQERDVGHGEPTGPLWTCLEQRGADLGSRLAAVFADLFAAGDDPVVIVGSDSPALPPEFVWKAFTLLGGGWRDILAARDSEAPARAELVLGPAFDGGYYLIGASRAAWDRSGAGITALLRDSPMGTPQVAEHTRTSARALGLRVAELPLWTDVDEHTDLTQAAGLLPGLNVTEDRTPVDRPARGGPNGRLREVYLHVTHRCGTGCPQCYLRDARDPSHDRSGELDTAAWLAITDEAAALGATGFVIMGGDPFLRPDLLFLIDHITGVHGAKARLFFNRSVSPELAAELARVGRGRLTPLLSIDGTEVVNDSLRGAGNSADARASIRALLGAGLRPVVNTVLLRPVLPTLPAFVRELARHGVATLHLILPHQRGGLADQTHLVPSGDELLPAVRALEEAASKVGVTIDNLAAWKGRLRVPRDFCGAGCDLLAVDPEGLVHACPITCGDDGFVAGELRGESLAEIWRRSPSLEFLRATHARDREECRACPVVDACGGECWVQAHYAARAQGERAGYLAPFPYCDLVRPILQGLGAGRAQTRPGDDDAGDDGDQQASDVDLTPFDCI